MLAIAVIASRSGLVWPSGGQGIDQLAPAGLTFAMLVWLPLVRFLHLVAWGMHTAAWCT